MPTTDENEDVTYKVADRRKFNPDGSVREGVSLDAPPPAPAEATPDADAPPAEYSEEFLASIPDIEPDEADADAAGEDAESELPGARDPASFVNFLSSLATNAAAALGAVPHPATGKRTVDLDSGKYWLDVLGMLRDKTDGNLHPQESRLFDGLLADLRMQYVQVLRLTEEKLKAQAAAKFSGEDILGRKP